MKLCWDNIENIKLTRGGNLYNTENKRTFYIKTCEGCNEEFIATRRESRFCCNSCSKLGNRNPLYVLFL